MDTAFSSCDSRSRIIKNTGTFICADLDPHSSSSPFLPEQRRSKPFWGSSEGQLGVGVGTEAQNGVSGLPGVRTLLLLRLRTVGSSGVRGVCARSGAGGPREGKRKPRAEEGRGDKRATWSKKEMKENGSRTCHCRRRGRGRGQIRKERKLGVLDLNG